MVTYWVSCILRNIKGKPTSELLTTVQGKSYLHKTSHSLALNQVELFIHNLSEAIEVTYMKMCKIHTGK